MGAGFDGALAMTSKRYAEFRSNLPEPQQDAHCRELYEKSTGQPLPRSDGDKMNAAYNTLLIGCGLAQIFEAAANAAGPTLTRAALSAATQNLGDVNPAFYLGGNLHQGKFDLEDNVRWLRFAASCTCWHLADTAVRHYRYT